MSRLPLIAASVTVTALSAAAADFAEPLQPFLDKHCFECHDEEVAKGGLDLTSLGTDLADPATMAKWVRVHDRVRDGEMPPAKKPRPDAGEAAVFTGKLAAPLVAAHSEQKGTVLRRLNRREYQNTLNDMLGVDVAVVDMLPEDGRSHEFDNVGEGLSLSMVHLRQYLEAADLAIDAAIAKTVAKPEPKTITASYKGSREGNEFIGKIWKELPDGAVVRFSGGGYPSGMLRGSNVREAGRYRVKVTGYAYQSEKPITFSVGGTSWARGSEKPIYGYAAFPPGPKPSTYEFETKIEGNYMIILEPEDIFDPERYKRKSIEGYGGPGLAILSVELVGPLHDEFPSRGHRLLFDGLERPEIEPRNPQEKLKSWYVPRFRVAYDDPYEDVREPLRRFAERAFRRPVATEEIGPYESLFEEQFKKGERFEDALRTAVAAMLCSPDFLFLRERPGWLDDYALASRLSYFLTRSLPDAELLAAAEAGTLRKDPKVLLAHTERLLDAAHHRRFVEDFTNAWLDLRDIEFTNPDAKLFPEFDRFLQFSMLAETRAFLAELIAENLPVHNLVKSDFAMLNSRLAKHYGIEGVSEPDLQRVKLPAGSPRGGFLSQGSVLKVSANGTNTSPVLRGVWVMERILGQTPQPPPPGIPGVEPDIRGAETLREMLVKHRDVQSCQSCHDKIDPPGFALESFNPVGGWRDNYRSLGEGEKPQVEVMGRRVQYRIGQPVDAAGRLPDGREFDGYLQFRDMLAEEEEMLAKTLATKLLVFATGREMGFSDRAEIERIAKESAKGGHGVRDLVRLVVTSEIFRRK